MGEAVQMEQLAQMLHDACARVHRAQACSSFAFTPIAHPTCWQILRSFTRLYVVFLCPFDADFLVASSRRI